MFMNIMLFISLLFGLQLIYWFAGRRAAKNLTTQEDYCLAGKNVRFFPLMMTFLATQVGGGLVLGAADEAFQYGWSVLFYPLGAALGMICLGLGFGQKLARLQVSTVAEILELTYRSSVLRKIAASLSVISLFMILAGQIIASHKFLAAIGIQSPVLFTLFWGIIIWYTAQGGLKAVIATDVVQAAFFSVVFLGCFAYVICAERMPELSMALGSFALGSSKLTGWLLMPLLYMIIEQDMGQRCFAGKSPRIVSKAAICAGVGTMVVSFIPIAFGVWAKSSGLKIGGGSSVLMTSIVYATNPWIAAIAGCAILAAIISTATSLITAISSNLAQDFEFLRGQKNLRVIRALTVAVSMAALGIAFSFNNVVSLLILSYELFVSCLFIPIVIALFKKKGEFMSGLLSILFGMVGFCLFKITPPPIPSELASILLSLVGYLCAEGWVRLRNRGKREIYPS
jgi:solute:Na+ symporter, SSS family